ncbi:MAG: tripartite tricarboxylate transporter substrate binding protein [Burkholderiales bacterium]|jgi:tripartite-type tricarboxylate transporter receptor subunit TctC|nr:tripartite tricarboxylate transporter substrate binding protein [Burkholderiales bacterium]
MHHRRIVLGAVLAAAAFITAPALAADPWPSKPIRIVVPYTPGGLTDVLARLVAQKASITLGQPIVIENKPGASTVIGAEFVARSPADGYTLLMSGTTTLSTNPILLKKLPYKTSDFTPVALIGMVPFIAVAHPSVPANNLKELVAYAQANPDKLTYSSSGTGTSSHLVGEMFESVTGTKLRDIPYKGTSPALTAVLSGEVSMTFDGVTLYIPHIQAGRLKPIALFGEQRVTGIEQVQTMVEQGYKDAIALAWFGLVAPAGTPREAVERVNDAVRKALSEPELVAKLREFNAYVEPRSASAFGELIQRESALWGRVLTPLNLQLD